MRVKPGEVHPRAESEISIWDVSPETARFRPALH